MKPITVGLIGYGTVGTGVARTLWEKSRWLQHRIGTRLELLWICDRAFRHGRVPKFPRGQVTTDADRVLNDPGVQIVVELIGGFEPARTIILRALRAGKHVVTANKALLAQAGPELFKEAERRHVDLYFEASVAGGIPIIKTLREGLLANEFDTIIGIVNGTSNYILTQMRDKQQSFHEALAEAKQRGYAERDPSLDIEGHDAAHKLSLLAWLGFGIQVKQKQISIEGIDRISQADIQYADELGYRIKPLAIAKEVENELEVRVHPTLLSKTHLLANVNGVYNGIYLHGDLVGSQVFYGRGAGQNPTASAVVSDIVDVARNILSGGTRRVAGQLVPSRRVRGLRRIGDIESRYYMRFQVMDRPGVLGRIAGILGRNNISIASVHQKERGTARSVPVVMMTHEAKESNVRRALAQIDRLGLVKQPTVTLRTEAPRAT